MATKTTKKATKKSKTAAKPKSAASPKAKAAAVGTQDISGPINQSGGGNT